MNIVTTGSVMPDPRIKDIIGKARQRDVQSFRKNDKFALTSMNSTQS